MSTNPKDIRFRVSTNAFNEQYYVNSRNNIEDPIFTGFTFNIDEKHSPLFFGGKNYTTSETLRSPDGTDTTLAEKIEENLAKVNKYAITGNPDTYDISTLPAKDPFGSTNGRKPGYGLWDKYYMDSVFSGADISPYGATDYIYMVDKVTDGAYTDDYGAVDLGNGTPTTSRYNSYNETLSSDPDLNMQSQAMDDLIDEKIPDHNTYIFFDNDKWDIRLDQEGVIKNLIEFLKSNPESTVLVSGYASKDRATAEHNWDLSINRAEKIKNELISNGISSSRITTAYYGDTVQPFEGIKNRAVTCQVNGIVSQVSALQYKITKEMSEITPDVVNAHKDLLDQAETAKKNYTKTINSKYKEYNDELTDLTSDVDKKLKEVQLELNEYKDEMSKYQSLLQSTIDKKDEYRGKIQEIYNQFEKYVKYINKEDLESERKDFNNIDIKYSVFYKNIKSEIIPITIDDVTNKFADELKQLGGDDLDQNCFKMTLAVDKTRLSSVKINPETEARINKLKELIAEESKKIYGVHEDGRPGTENDPAEGSLCDLYQTALDKVQNDDYSKQKNKINELTEIFDNYDDLQEYNNYQSGKNVTEKNLPSIDYTMSPQEEENPTLYNERINRAKRTRAMYEVPQTVYDILGFIRGMYSLTSEYPYAMQTVTGLDEAYKKYFDMKDPYMGSGDGKITISCLDYLDMRVSSMFNKYFNAVYDRQYRRERVPINLRRFQCSIFVHDIRNFKNSITNDMVDNSGDLSLITEIALNCLSAIEFKFYDCEIVPEETGGIFENVTNLPNNDMRTTNFTFTYGNCIINFLPFEDLRKYVLGNKENKDLKPVKNDDTIKSAYTEYPDGTTRRDGEFEEEYQKVIGNPVINNRLSTNIGSLVDDSGNKVLNEGGDRNFRRWFDRSELGNVNNNDYREYIRRDSAVAVDDHYKTTIVNNFALNSVSNKNQELTMMDDALRRIVIGISASTGIPVPGVADALNIKFIDPIINEKNMELPGLKEIGNVNTDKPTNEKTTDYVGTVAGESKQTDLVNDLGNVEKQD